MHTEQDEIHISREIRKQIGLAAILIVLLFGGAGGWAATTNLAGAVVTSGTFIVGSRVKTIQHAGGGIIKRINVKDGDQVKAGDTLLILDETQIQANLGVITKRLNELYARKTRLEAERDQQSDLLFPEILTRKSGQKDIANILRSERELFTLRMDSLAGRKDQLAQRITQLDRQITGLKTQEKSAIKGQKIIERELGNLNILREKSLVSMQRINALEREAASLEGEEGKALASQASAAGQIVETRQQIIQLDQDWRSKVAEELRDVEGQISENEERQIAALDDLERLTIKTPVDGVVNELTTNTIGGVISPAQMIMSIVPRDELVLEAKVMPKDIDQLSLGQTAILRLSAFNQRTTPELEGHVTHIAADIIQDPQTGFNYYQALIKVTDKQIDKLDGRVLIAGMPADAFIQTEERTALSYLVKPLNDQIMRAFREE